MSALVRYPSALLLMLNNKQQYWLPPLSPNAPTECNFPSSCYTTRCTADREQELGNTATNIFPLCHRMYGECSFIFCSFHIPVSCCDIPPINHVLKAESLWFISYFDIWRRKAVIHKILQYCRRLLRLHLQEDRGGRLGLGMVAGHRCAEVRI